MFSLIISIISIALVAALAAATVYFGGAAFNKGSAGADASTFINAGQQIAGAFTLASADGHSPTLVADLNTGKLGESAVGALDGEIYLAQIPSYKGSPFVVDTTETNYVLINVKSEQVCEEINKRASGSTTALADVDGLYGCQVDVAKPTEFNAFYKVL